MADIIVSKLDPAQIIRKSYDEPNNRIRVDAEISNLEVAIENESILITGRTDRYYMKQLATSAVIDEPIGYQLNVRNSIQVGRL